MNLIIRWVFQLDSQATQFINELIPHNRFFDLFFSFFSMKGGSILIWIGIIALLIIFEETRPDQGRGKISKKLILYFLLSLFLTSLVVFGMKHIIQRPRPVIPPTTYNLQPISCPSDYSFPSGHASTALAAATVTAFFDKKRRYFYFLIAGLIGLSRIYLGCHYFLDVVGGGIIGYLIGKAVLSNKKI